MFGCFFALVGVVLFGVAVHEAVLLMAQMFHDELHEYRTSSVRTATSAIKTHTRTATASIGHRLPRMKAGMHWQLAKNAVIACKPPSRNWWQPGVSRGWRHNLLSLMLGGGENEDVHGNYSHFALSASFVVL